MSAHTHSASLVFTAAALWARRYASLYFAIAIQDGDNELIALEIIHRYVELLDKYFGSVRTSGAGQTAISIPLSLE